MQQEYEKKQKELQELKKFLEIYRIDFNIKNTKKFKEIQEKDIFSQHPQAHKITSIYTKETLLELAQKHNCNILDIEISESDDGIWVYSLNDKAIYIE